MSEGTKPYPGGAASMASDGFAELWRLSGPNGHTVLNKAGQVVCEIQHCPPEVRQRIVECVNATAGIQGPEAFVFDCLAALRPFAEFWQRNPDFHQALRSDPEAKETIVDAPLAFLERTSAVLVAGGRGRMGITEQVSQALWKALVALSQSATPEESIARTVALLRLALKRISALEGVQ